MGERPRHLLLVGGGHAHVAVLADWIENGLPCEAATLLTPSRTLRYSGMVPGWIAGQYARDEGTVDVGALAERAGAKLILGRCTAIEPQERRVRMAGGQAVEFDIASIDTGGVGRARAALGDDPRLIDIRPIQRFVDEFDKLEGLSRIAVIGGGAGGTELAFALRNRGHPRPQVTFITGSCGLLPDLSGAVRRKVSRELERQGIEVIERDAKFVDGELVANDCSLEPPDLIVAALGSAAPEWPGKGGLATDTRRFIAVDRYQRSTSHPHVFAVGDVASRSDRHIPHSGVHAVLAGPKLAANLRAAMAGERPREVYRPRWNNLYLLNTGDGGAIASYGPLAAQGRWVMRLKDWIDRRWLEKYARAANRL